MALPHMNYCMECGTKLVKKYLASEGKDSPFCPTCNDYRFPVFNAGVSMIITDKEKEHILLIKQYGGDEYVLCAGYINIGEDAEDAAQREMKEELDLTPISLSFNHSHYYVHSNTLLFNYTAVVENMDAIPNEEIDTWKWFSIEEARQVIRKNSLAKSFLLGYLDGTYTFPEVPCSPYKEP